MTDYLKAAVEKDWPAMGKETESPETNAALSKIYDAVLKFHAISNGEGLVLTQILGQLDAVTNARRERLVVADGIVANVIWTVLFVGAALTVGFTFFFGAENLRAQAIITGVLAVLIFAGLLTIIAIDHPFAGTVKIGPEALSNVLRDFSEAPAQR